LELPTKTILEVKPLVRLIVARVPNPSLEISQIFGEKTVGLFEIGNFLLSGVFSV
jgi:hypothetical protein